MFQLLVADDRSAIQSVQMDDASLLVTYTGFDPVGVAAHDGISVGPSDYASTLSMTSTAGASASVKFHGASRRLRHYPACDPKRCSCERCSVPSDSH